MKGKAAMFFKVLCLSVIILLLVLTVTSCIRIVGFRGSGNVTTEERNVSGFDSVSVASGIDLYIDQNGTETLKIEAESNVVPLIRTEVRSGHLEIDFTRSIYSVFGGLNLTKPIKIYLTVKDLNEIDVSSGSTLRSESLKSGTLKLDLSSGADGKITVDVSELKINLSSGSGLVISGKTLSQDVDLSSGSSYDAEELASENAILGMSSGASAIIDVSKSLKVDISSGASVKYSGSPEIISNISSGGSLQSIP